MDDVIKGERPCRGTTRPTTEGGKAVGMAPKACGYPYNRYNRTTFAPPP